MIIIAENSVDSDGNGFIDFPDDEGDRNPPFGAGTITFDFDDPVRSVGFDLVDVEGVGLGEEPGNAAVFLLGGAPVATISFADSLAGGAFDRGAVFGDKTVNRIAPIGGFGPFDRVAITLGGSGAVDNLVVAVPEPGMVPLLAVGLAWVGAARRRS